MKIAVMSTFPPKKCGVGVYTRNLVNAMSGFADVTVISFKGFDYTDRRVVPLISSWLSYFRVALFIKKEKFDKVIIQYDYLYYNLLVFPFFLFLLRLFGFNPSLIIHTVASYSDFFRKTLFRLYHSYLLLFTKKVFVHTVNAKNKLLGSTVVKKPVEIVFHPILVRDTAPRVHRKGKIRLLCFGFIVWDKGTDIAIKAFGNARNVSLKFVGSIPVYPIRNKQEFLDEVKNLASQYKNIELVNRFVSEEEKADAYTWCDFVVMPYRSIEQSGIIAEAWSFQRIPVCSDIRALREDAGSGRYGVLFKAGDIDDLKKTVFSLAKDSRMQEKLLSGIKQVIKDRDFTKLSKDFVEKSS